MALPLAVVYLNLAHLHQAGVAWPEAIDAAAGADAPRFSAVKASLAGGVGVAASFAPVVPPLDLAGLRAAEASGRFEELLRSLADRRDADASRDKAQRAALLYPVFLAHVAALLLPIPDIAAGRAGSGLLWILLILGPLYAYFGLSRAARRAAERDPAAAERGLFRLVRSKASEEEADARALTSLAWLVEAGVPPLEALPLAASAGAGGPVAADLSDAVEDVRRGRPITSSWRRSSDAIRSSCATGESVGAFSPSLARCADQCLESAAYRRKRFASIAPVVVMLVVGGVIGFRVISFYAGVFRGYSNFK